MNHEPQDDIFDYPMGDTFVSETRPRPFQMGVRPCRPHLCIQGVHGHA